MLLQKGYGIITDLISRAGEGLESGAGRKHINQVSTALFNPAMDQPKVKVSFLDLMHFFQ